MPLPNRWLTMESAATATILRFAVDSIPHDTGEEIVRDIREGLYGLVDQGKHRLLINFDHLLSFPTLIVGPLLGLHRRLRSVDGKLAVVCGPDTFARECFEILNLGKIFRLYHTEAEALADF